MPDLRRHRGPHPEDTTLFGERALPTLRSAARDLCDLLDRGYPVQATLKLVGDRYALRDRQRKAVQRCACTASQLERRASRRAVEPKGGTLWIDGFNVLTTVEAALAGGVLLIGRDGAMRDMASMHGSYRRVEETKPALHAIADTVEVSGVRACRWFLDAPVSNSGRLRARILDVARERGVAWTVDVVPDPDRVLVDSEGVVVASADAGILDGVRVFWDLACATVAARVPERWVVDLSPDSA